MTRQFGDRATFGVEIGEIASPGLRVVDLWAADTWLTSDDNAAYVPSFVLSMRRDAERVRRGDVPPCPFPGRPPQEIHRLLLADQTEFREQFWFLQWGETVDNVAAFAYRDGDLVIVFQAWPTKHSVAQDRAEILAVRIPPDDFAAIVEDAAAVLDAESPR
ncbi:hypothetical protein [Jidongwangia harbinensis]|uniref:hypothetical protein n=1 Tax=Jidongwangia harbinensis TaxID=2878561 RepID=UPI001CDA15FC|nr:hypothetical protein [Jidongwangia harbinensis]MCA2216955.1 hypothetical protein [Jidongwangia harbinensis]